MAAAIGAGLPIQSPVSNNGLSSLLFQSTFQNRVPGAPLFLHNLNCGCYDPNTQLVLNPAAWTDAGAGQWGTAAAYYEDYRYQRRPLESMSLGKRFPIKERMVFSIRVELFNIFNRVRFGTGNTNLQDQNFGKLTSSSDLLNSPRQLQLALKLYF